MTAASFQLPPEGVNLEDAERRLVVQALERASGKQTRTARFLGVHRDQVHYRIEKFGLSKGTPVTSSEAS